MSAPPGRFLRAPLSVVAARPIGWTRPLVLSLALHAAIVAAAAAALAQLYGARTPEPPTESVNVLFGWEGPDIAATAPPPAIELAPPTPEPPAPAPSIPDPAAPPMLASVSAPRDLRIPDPMPGEPALRPAATRNSRPARKSADATRSSSPGRAGVRDGASLGWHLAMPAYPHEARLTRLTGRGVARITTDARGRVVRCEIEGLPPLLAANTRDFARATWTGPPNSTRTVTVIYRLN